MKKLSRNEIIARAEKEPERIKFWIGYVENFLKACEIVVENPPCFDEQWKTIFPDPEEYKKYYLHNDLVFGWPEWVSVDEKLPETKEQSDCSEVILVYNEFHDEIVTAVFFPDNGMWSYTGAASSRDHNYCCSLEDKQITHWMPQPKKPHEMDLSIRRKER